MPRAKKQEEHENHERWLVSYADFITLLFAFFVVMYSVSSVNEGKYRVLSDSLLSAFHSAPKSLEPIQVGKPSKSTMVSDLSIVASPNIMISPGKGMPMVERGGNNENNVLENDAVTDAAGDAALEKIAKDIETAMSSLIDIGLVKVRRNDLWLEIEIKNSILFSEGSAKLKPDVIPVLNTLANIISIFPNSIRVEGFTDDIEKSDNIYPTNWELSSARSSSIVRLFEIGGVLPERLSAVGFGQYRPVADNSTEEGRQKNRRVVIVVVANNDVTGTVKLKKPENVKNIEFSVIELENKGLVEEILVLESSRKSDAELLPNYENIEIDFSTPNTILVKPLLSPPIRLFRPIELPDKEIQEETRR